MKKNINIILSIIIVLSCLAIFVGCDESTSIDFESKDDISKYVEEVTPIKIRHSSYNPIYDDTYYIQGTLKNISNKEISIQVFINVLYDGVVVNSTSKIVYYLQPGEQWTYTHSYKNQFEPTDKMTVNLVKIAINK